MIPGLSSLNWERIAVCEKKFTIWLDLEKSIKFLLTGFGSTPEAPEVLSFRHMITQILYPKFSTQKSRSPKLFWRTVLSLWRTTCLTFVTYNAPLFLLRTPFNCNREIMILDKTIYKFINSRTCSLAANCQTQILVHKLKVCNKQPLNRS